MTRNRILLALVALLLVAAGLVGAYVITKWRASQDVRGSSSVEFVTTAGPDEPVPVKNDKVSWPMYGYDARRARV